jgi:hypothetical protein
MLRSHGCERAAMFRTKGMLRSHGCERAAMFRTKGMLRSHGCERAAMFRTKGMLRSHGCERAAMFRTKGMLRLHGCERTAMFRTKGIAGTLMHSGVYDQNERLFFCSRQKLITNIHIGNTAIILPFFAIFAILVIALCIMPRTCL